MNEDYYMVMRRIFAFFGKSVGKRIKSDHTSN